MMRRRFACRLNGIAAALAATIPAAAGAQVRPVPAACGPAVPLAQPIARASARFAIPEPLIRAVIAVESNFAVFAVSPKGAMGLMQLMPGTWRELRLRYALGTDPFDPCDNIIAGTAYLRELRDRYGDPGFLAAYNAGPGRYEAHLRGSRPLPAETLAYVARVSAGTTGIAGPSAVRTPSGLDSWRRGALFVERSAAAQPRAPVGENAGAGETRDARRADPSGAHADSIFVARSAAPQ
jgi:soluble lytic murein transglycosylase-like protein